MRRLLELIVQGLLLIILAGGCAANAAQGKGAERPTYSLTVKFLKLMEKAQEHAQKKEWDEALAELNKVAKRDSLNPYERATLLNARAGVRFAMNDQPATTKDLEEAAALDAMPEGEQLDLEYNLAQSYFQEMRFDDSADVFAKWASRASGVEASRYFVAASTLSQVKRYAEALPLAQKAVAGMKPPTESWMVLVASLQLALKNDPGVADALQHLIAAFPKKEYWLHLSETYITMGDEPKAIATLEAAQSKGLLTDQPELVALAQLYLRQGAAAKAAALLDEQIKAGKVEKVPVNLELLAKCWLVAKDLDRAQAVLAMPETDVSSGDVYLELGRLLIERKSWVKAREALSTAVQKGGMQWPGDARLLLGIAHYNLKDKSAALAALGEAQKSADSAKCAAEWIQIVKGGKPPPEPSCASTNSAARTTSESTAPATQ
jgi:uncharacterized protein HemY